MKRLLIILITILTLMPDSITLAQNAPIIPYPVSIEYGGSDFTWNETTQLIFEEEKNSAAKQILLEFGHGFKKEAIAGDFTEASNNSVVFLFDSVMLHDEGYSISINEERIEVKGKTQQGWFYAWQSIKQLFPVSFLKIEEEVELPFTITGMEIVDYPRFEYRGLHLDVCRHFFSVKDVKKYIDLLAMHKMNRFHWHLTEDQGWRIEIKKYPKLTEIGAFRKETLIGHYSDRPHQFDGERYGGFYTQDEIKEVVRYASQRQITIVPEIEMPGHSLAALAAYPELACTEGPFEVATKWGVFEDVYCPTEKTFTFINDVLTEVAALFPGEYIHIGGDECPKTSWKESAFCQQLIQDEGLKDEYELQSYFIKRVEEMLSKLGKKLIGWDEILEGGLSPNATVMSWRGTSGGIAAAKLGHDVIMTPGTHCYFDHYQSDHAEEPVAIGGYTPLKKVYAYEPVPDVLTSEEAKYIMGAQANVWTEYIGDFSHVEYMAYPRACALAEVLWSPVESRSYSRFLDILYIHFQRLDALGVNYAKSVNDVQMEFSKNEEKNIVVELKTELPNAIIKYTTNGKDPDFISDSYKDPIQIMYDSEIKARAFTERLNPGRLSAERIYFHKGLGKQIELEHPAHEKYNSGGAKALLNGVKGSGKRYGDKEWLGFSGTDFIALVDFKKAKSLRSVNTRFYHGPGQWIHGPKMIRIYSGNDPQSLVLIAEKMFDPKGKFKALPFSIEFPKQKKRYLKIVAENFGKIPEGLQGAGHDAWLFVDELIIE